MLGKVRSVMMKCCMFLLLLGSFFILGHCVFPNGSCDGYTNITEPWRNVLFKSTSFIGYPKNDSHLVGQWWRFTGISGDRITSSCLYQNFVGTYYPMRLDFTLPTTESETPTVGPAYARYGTSCHSHIVKIEAVLCPGGFYIFRPLSHPSGDFAYATNHHVCNPDSCGPLAECTSLGGCKCISGYEMNPDQLPTPDAYVCDDIDECQTVSGICGSYSNCTNTIGSHFCTCHTGFNATNPALPPSGSNNCIDINECLNDVCGNGTCVNNIGSFVCKCYEGYQVVPSASPLCQDIDECFNSTVCGPNSACTNIIGAYTCVCLPGYAPTLPNQEPSETNICIDVNECDEDPPICGPDANCTNSIGSYSCTCFFGYRLKNQKMIASISNPCTDINECMETPQICGIQTVCTNAPGTFDCSCPEKFYPSTGLEWKVGVTFCKNLQNILDEIEPAEGQTKERAFLGNIAQQLKLNAGTVLSGVAVANNLAACLDVSGVGPGSSSATLSSEGDGETGSMILGISELLVSAMVQPGSKQTKTTVKTSTMELTFETIGPDDSDEESSLLSVSGNTMQINLGSLAKNGSASAAFMTLNGMESLLSHQYFETENTTEMYSNVITAIVPSMNVTNLTEPVNFTIYHMKAVPESGLVTCVYWEDKTQETGTEGKSGSGGKKNMRWSVDGCWVAYTNENYTVCSCSHLSTFALIMQIGEPPPENLFLEWLNRVCVIIGLFFFALAILTFLLCSWNPKINNTARLHLCLSLALTHLLLLWNDRYLENELACTVMAGLLHFLVVASFVWMLLEGLQLFLLVRRLTKVQVIQRDGLPRPLLYLIGYGVPFVVVGVSGLVYSDGYGATEADACWLSRKRNFNWALTGPVVTVLAFNCIMFSATLWSLRTTLANMKSGASQSQDTRLIVFKIVAQFVILGIPWILGLYQTNLFFQVLFIILNSQQGTFLYIVHCVFNKEVREEYIKWLTCYYNKPREGGSVKDAPSVTDDVDKAE